MRIHQPIPYVLLLALVLVMTAMSVTQAGTDVPLMTTDELKAMLATAGFKNIEFTINEQSAEFIRDWLPGSGAENFVASAIIQAVKAC